METVVRILEQKNKIDITISGKNVDLIIPLIMEKYPNALVQGERNKTFNKKKLLPALFLLECRTKKGLTVRDLENLTGIRYTNISAMENGNRVIGLNVAKKLAKVLDCEYTDLL